MHSELHKKYQESQERTNNIRDMLHASALFLGEGEAGIQWYVLDGKLYCDKSHTQLECSGNYHECCQRFRRVDGRLPWWGPNGEGKP